MAARLAGWLRRGRPRGSLHWLTLRFRDPGQEAGFLKARKPKLIASMRKATGVVVVGVFAELAMFQAWDLSPDRYDTEEQMAINQRSNLMFATLWAYALVLFAFFSLPCAAQRVSPAAIEALCLFAVCSAMGLFVCCMPHYAGRLMGHDTHEFLMSWQLTDQFILLGLNTCVTATHILLPMRFHLMVFIEACAVLLYVLAALIIGSPHPENVPDSVVAFVMLVVLAGYGKRSLERDERTQFLALISEKRLRFESEFELATYKEQRRRHALEDAHSEVQSVSKASSKSFELNSSDLTFQALLDLGLKEQWLIREQEVQLLSARPLGEGGFGVVVRGQYHGAQVAVKAPKRVQAGGVKDGFLAATCNELRILRRLRHPNIVVLYGAVLTSAAEGAQLCLVLELIGGESLRRYIARSRERDDFSLRSSAASRSRVLVDAAAALRYLHSRQPVVVHGDIKDSNIFVDQRGDQGVQAKLLDFGLSRLVNGNARPMGGTLRWAAPEVLSGSHSPTAATDVFSLGRVLFYVATGQAPLSQVPDARLRRHLLRSPGVMHWPAGQDGDLADLCRPLAQECTRARAELRPCARDIYSVLAGMERQIRGSTGSGGGGGQSLPGSEMAVFGGFDFASEELHSTSANSSSKHLAAVPESEPLREPDHLVRGSYRPTPNDTLMKAVGLVLMQSNHRVGVRGSCCWLHCGVDRLRAVCNDMQEIECDGWDVPVEGQCANCHLLFVSDGVSPRVCSFCQGAILSPEQIAESTSDGGVPVSASLL